ncbi:hydantoinase/carbamoylase family amidase [Fodinicurvata sp. EGI_FJ10296]|uniref:hydantoinase/carbamoylase family amidase n=1 Tax=Fodinicurvata sp. EGI_FJ10296 TaxID=3231908 RepID=UPI0034569214
MSYSIDSDRLMADLRALAEFGKRPPGVHRPAFSAEDIAARKWLMTKLKEAGLTPEMDRLGTVIGRHPGAKRAILVGSHTDTVPNGGWLDGAMGVIYALEIARTIMENEPDGEIGVDVIDFQDEEGSFLSVLGSKVFVGSASLEDALDQTNHEGVKLAEILPTLDLPDGDIRLDRDRHVAFLETHIEQGPRLLSAGVPIGVVPSIAGIRRYEISTEGRPDHAGTTPVPVRRDAGMAVMCVATAIDAAFRQAASDGSTGPGAGDAVWNAGAITFRPGAYNVVPEAADLLFEIRAPDAETIAAMDSVIRKTAEREARARDVELTITDKANVAPTAMDDGAQQALRDGAGDLQMKYMDLTSGAGHDAMVMADHVPTGLMFVPSINGRSHCLDEDTDEADIIAGCKAMFQAVRRLRSSLS